MKLLTSDIYVTSRGIWILAKPFELERLRKQIDPDKTYTVDIKPIQKQRSLKQNAYLWELIHEINVAYNGGRPTDDEDIYIQILEKANVKPAYLVADERAEDILKRAYRYVYKMDKNEDGTALYKCLIGTSDMTSKEMSVVIDTALDYAAELGIETDYWRGLLCGRS